MKRNFIIAFAVGAVVLAILAFAAWSLFEIEPAAEWVSSSREARTNNYLALDRWLGSNGIPFRVENSGNLMTLTWAQEKQIFIQASLFRWNKEALEYLARWVEEGGHLFLVVDYQTDPHFEEEELFLLLEKIGITVSTESDYHYDPDSPSYDHSINLEVEDEEALTLNDHEGFTRLVQQKYGKGKITVSGKPRFLFSSSLEDAPNARLSWFLFKPQTEENEGWLFIRGTTKVRGLFGSLWRQGNLTVLLIAVLILLVVCFWAIIPLFGLAKKDDERPGKPLSERFLAEGRFLKRYGALNVYCKAYVKEIKRCLAHKEGLLDNEMVEKRIMEIMEKSEEKNSLLLRALRGDRFSYSEFPEMVTILKNTLERI